jgi:GT2 family glycosyltransferase
MQATVIIPVWNGASVILDSLHSLYQNTGDELLEVICVDNASSDTSAVLIAECYPQVQLYCQPANLGFAGGINAGVRVAKGDLFVLLNQDCMVQRDWLAHILAAMDENPEWGIAGCTLLDADGKVEHAGAYLDYPSIRGVHILEPALTAPHTVNHTTGYVTGALFVIRRSLWEEIGPFDEDFYPAYYEETDFCYRARRAGYAIGYVPQAQAIHLRSSSDWHRDPLHHAANQELSRYRFVIKHLCEEDVLAFADYEQQEIRSNPYFDAVVARALAARKTLRSLPATVALYKNEQEAFSLQRRYRLLQTEFRRIMHRATLIAQKLSLSDLLDQSREWHQQYEDERLSTAELLAQLAPDRHLLDAAAAGPELSEDFAFLQQVILAKLQATAPDSAAWQQLQVLQQEEHKLIHKIYLTSPQSTGAEPSWQKLRRYFLRILNFVSGREYMLQSHLNAVHTARMDALQHLYELQRQTDQSTYEAVNSLGDSLMITAQHVRVLKQLHRRLQLVELLTDYDER